MKKSDMILVGIVIAAALAGMFLFSFGQKGREVVISRNGIEEQRLSLEDDGQFLLKGKKGQENELVIEGGQVFISHATCADKICVKQGKILDRGETIVCLPHKLVISIE